MFITRRHLANSYFIKFYLKHPLKGCREAVGVEDQGRPEVLGRIIYLLKPLQVRSGWELWVKSESVGWALFWAKEIKSKHHGYCLQRDSILCRGHMCRNIRHSESAGHRCPENQRMG